MTDQELNEAMARIEGLCDHELNQIQITMQFARCQKCKKMIDVARDYYDYPPDYCNSRDDAVRVFEGLTPQQKGAVAVRLITQMPPCASRAEQVARAISAPPKALVSVIVEVVNRLAKPESEQRQTYRAGIYRGIKLPARELCEAIVEVMKK